MRSCYDLPEQIELPCGAVLKVVFGSHLNGKRFIPEGAPASNAAIITEARKRRLKYRRVSCLARGLRGKLDLHRSPYRPNEYVFVEVPELRKEQRTPNADFIEGIDCDRYDVESMKIDDRNKNFTPDRVEEYRHETIVVASILNGQFSQARQQCRAYGLSYDRMKVEAGV